MSILLLIGMSVVVVRSITPHLVKMTDVMMNRISSSITAAVEQQGAATAEIARNVQQVAEGTNR